MNDKTGDHTASSAMPADGDAATPVDLPEGSGGLLQESWTQVSGLLEAGGPVVAILLVLSVAALSIVLLKLWQFHRARLGDSRKAAAALRLYRARRIDEALALSAQSPNPVLQVLAGAMRGQQQGLEERRVREEAMRIGNEALEHLRALHRPLEVIASLAPLLGLFGTVLGMIEAFRQLSEAGRQVDPSILSGGIWEALLTTAVGLAVAIPCVALLNWLDGRVDRVAFELESLVTQVFTVDLSADAA